MSEEYATKPKRRKKIISFTIDSDLYEALKGIPNLNLSGLVNDLLRIWLDLGQSEKAAVKWWLEYVIERKSRVKRELEALEAEEERLRRKLAEIED